MDALKSGDQPNATSLGQILRSRRKVLGLTQGQVADLASCHLDFVSDLERDKPTVRLDKLKAVLHVLGLRIAIVEDRE